MTQNHQRTAADNLMAAGMYLSRRQFLYGAGATAATGLLAACGSSAPSQPQSGNPKDQGTVVVWYSEQEKPMTTYINEFTKATGIPANGVRVASSDQIPKLEDAKRAGTNAVDVIMSADISVAHRLREQEYIEPYQSKEADAYPAKFQSDPPGWWTAFYLAVEAIGYDPGHVDPDQAPKSYEDLLDPRWKDKLAFQDSTAGSQYLWWYIMKDKLPGNYFQLLKPQSPTGYPSSTAIVQQLRSGNMLVAGKFSDFQFAVAQEQGQPLGAVYPDLGVVTGPHGISLVTGTPRPDAAKAFIDYTLSKEGQESYTKVSGARSGRPDVKTPWVNSLSADQLLTVPTDQFEDYVNPETAAEFQKIWRDIVGS